VSSLIPRPESHDEDGRDSIEKFVAERSEQSIPTMAVISCSARLLNGPILDLRQHRDSTDKEVGDARGKAAK